jgi:hypothetical protein
VSLFEFPLRADLSSTDIILIRFALFGKTKSAFSLGVWRTPLHLWEIPFRVIYAMARTGKAGKNLTHQAVFHYTPFHIFLFKSTQLSFDSYGYLLLQLDVEAVF